MDELALTHDIALRQPADLPFRIACSLVTVDRSPCRFRRPESEARRNALLDEAMVLQMGKLSFARAAARAL
jgi:hypothetical protein